MSIIRNLLRCRRGTIALVTVIAATPVIGFMALGAEAGVWYITKQHAQNAADSAAMAAALSIANGDTQSASQWASGFATGDVTIARGTYDPTTGFTNTGSGSAIQAVVSKCQAQSISLIYTSSTCNGTANSVLIRGTAVAVVGNPSTACVLALTGTISFQDNGTVVNATGCTLTSNSTGVGLDLTHTDKVKVAGFSTSGTCTGTCSSNALTYQPPVYNPLAGLNTALDSVTLSSCTGSGLKAYVTGTSTCANNNYSGSAPITTSGVYFFSGNFSGSISMAAGVKATLIFLRNATCTTKKPLFSMVGNNSINVTAQSSVPTTELPSALSSIAGLLSGVAIYGGDCALNLGGNSSITATGVIYLPKTTVSMGGNNSISTCSEMIVGSIAFAGSSNFGNSCPTVAPGLKSQLVTLVQ